MALCEQGYADRMVLSHDASCFMDWFGPNFTDLREVVMPNWHYEHISDDVIPMLVERGVSQADLDQMMTGNPARYFS